MGASNYPGLALPKKRAKALEDEAQARTDRQHQIVVYHDVDVRDRRQCTCCGRRGNPYAMTTLGKLHHDHLQGGSGRRMTQSSNVVLLCWICHEFKTANQITPHGNPDKGTLRYDVEASAAKVIFKGRKKPLHVRIVETDGR